MVAQDEVVPDDPQSFRSRYINEIEVAPTWWQRLMYGTKPGIVESLKNGRELKKRLSPYVDVFDAEIEKPQRIDEVIHTGMTPEQLRAYHLVQKNMPLGIWSKLVSNLPPSKAEARQLNAFLTGVRQVSNTPEGYDTKAHTGEKIKTAVSQLRKKMAENPELRALVYSNFMESGIGSYAKQLDKLGIPYGMYTGDLTSAQKKELVDLYNSGKLPVLLASGAGSEGLDLKGTRLIQLLEPHWNDSRLQQVIGRGIRYKSHANLPKEDRNVLVQKYIADLPDRGYLFWKRPQTSVDNYLVSRAEEKDRLIREVKDILA